MRLDGRWRGQLSRYGIHQSAGCSLSWSNRAQVEILQMGSWRYVRNRRNSQSMTVQGSHLVLIDLLTLHVSHAVFCKVLIWKSWHNNFQVTVVLTVPPLKVLLTLESKSDAISNVVIKSLYDKGYCWINQDQLDIISSYSVLYLALIFFLKGFWHCQSQGSLLIVITVEPYFEKTHFLADFIKKTRPIL